MSDDTPVHQQMMREFPLPLGPETMMAPDRLVQPHNWAPHIPFAFWLIGQHKPRLIVELGTHTGNSYLAFCQAVASSRTECKCFAVDTWLGDKHAGNYGPGIFKELSHYHDQKYISFSKLLRCSFDEALDSFSDGSVDILHIDGLHAHTYEAVKLIFDAWLPKMSRRGVVLLHDTNVVHGDFGVWRLWEEVRSKYPSFSFKHALGLGVVSVGDKTPPGLAPLFGQDGIRQAEQIRGFFQGLGARFGGRADEGTTEELGFWIARAHKLQKRASAQQAELNETRRQLNNIALPTSGIRQAWRIVYQLYRLPAVWRRSRLLRSECNKIRKSGLFDEAWYLSQCSLGIQDDPILHYLREGTTLSPHPLFDADWYLKQYPRKIRAHTNPLLDYLRESAWKRRDPNPLFHSAYYLSQGPDLSAGQTPLANYDKSWRSGAPNPNALFDNTWYATSYLDRDEPSLNPLAHYIHRGAAEGAMPCPQFDPTRYVEETSDKVAAAKNPLAHFFRDLRRSDARRALPPSCFLKPVKQHTLGRLVTSNFISNKLGRVSSDWTLLPSVLPSTVSADAPRSVEPVDIILPVYDGVEQTQACIKSVLQSRSCNSSFKELILIDDCGPSAELRNYLQRVAAEEENVVLVQNTENLGFVRSVNRGLQFSSLGDVVLLNSDTLVNGSWLDRLSRQAHTESDIGTVTPFSNNATICSFPDLKGHRDLPYESSLRELDSACAEANRLRAVEVPTAVGFCMLIKRACLDETGELDEAFGAGYGEENDFCLRASRHGWRHILAGDIFVFHEGEASFGSRSSEHRGRATALITKRHPEYFPAVSQWSKIDPALPLRIAALAALWRRSNQPTKLHISHDLGGGTEKHIQKLAQESPGKFANIVLMVSQGRPDFLVHLMLQEPSGWRCLRLSVESLVQTAPLLASFGLSRIHIHHAAHLSNELAPFLRSLGKPYDITVHDYSLMCPRMHLVSRGKYCGEPDEAGCLECLIEDPPALSSDIILWRHRGLDLLANAENVFCPSSDVARRVGCYAPDASVAVVPHENEWYHPKNRELQLTPMRPGVLRVAVLGTITETKGRSLLLECAQLAQERDINIQWIVIGELRPKIDLPTFDLHETGPYEVKDLARLIAETRPNLLLYLQQCPETYSFTLSEGLASGLPIVAPRIGSFTERLSGLQWCWTYDSKLSAPDIVALLRKIARENLMTGTAPNPPAGLKTSQFEPTRSSEC
jgi:GT2 family glycosyltransferase